MGNTSTKPEKKRSLSLGSLVGVGRVLSSMDERKFFSWKGDRKSQRSSEVSHLHTWSNVSSLSSCTHEHHSPDPTAIRFALLDEENFGLVCTTSAWSSGEGGCE